MEKLILVKLGGSLITDKLTPYKANHEVIERLAKEIKEALEEKKLNLVVGHGSGSFGHQSAHKYQTQKGLINEKSIEGLAVVQNDAAKLNRIVVEGLVKNGVNAISFQPSAGTFCENKKIIGWDLENLRKMLELGLVPVPHGDIGFDKMQGCCITSTEEVLSYLARNLKEYSSEIIMVGKVEGVCTADPTKDKNAKLINEINKDNWDEIKKYLAGSDGTDVTGGMIHKIEQSIELSKKGMPVRIISGLENGNLKKALLGENIGTLIKW